MSNLFWHTLSQGLQAFTPLAAAVAWFEHGGQPRRAAAVRTAWIAAAPTTAVAAWWFQASSRRALDEAILAWFALAIAAAFARAVWRRRDDRRRPDAGPTATWPIVASATLIAVRQTMEIGIAF